MKKETCDLECPKCHKVWAKLKYQFGKEVMASDVTVLTGNKKFKNGDVLACTLCGHETTSWDVILSIHSSLKLSPEVA